MGLEGPWGRLVFEKAFTARSSKEKLGTFLGRKQLEKQGLGLALGTIAYVAFRAFL
jgi:hypothetical protein